MTKNHMLSGWVLLVVLLLASNVWPAQPRTSDGLYNYGWIDSEKSEALNVGADDFLIVFRVCPDEVKRSNISLLGIVSKMPAGRQPGYTVGMSSSHGLSVKLQDNKRESNGKLGYNLGAGKFFKPGAWVSGAVTYNHKKRRVTYYKDGKKLSATQNIVLNNLDNWEAFLVGTSLVVHTTRFKGKIDYTGVFRFEGRLPESIDAEVAALARDGKIPETLKKSKHSFWKLTSDGAGAKDAGSNGLTLHYIPESDKLRFPDMARTFTAPNPKTFYVDNSRRKASDEGPGTEAEPFKTIQRAVSRARAGDTVRIRKGVYREAVSISGGRLGAPIRVIGEKGVVITSAGLLKGWKPVKGRPGVFAIRSYKNTLLRPGDPKKVDARREPRLLIFYNGYPLKWVAYPEDLVPGSVAFRPLDKYSPKDVYIFPSPDEPKPARTKVEISGAGGFRMADFVEVENVTIEKAGVGMTGRGCRFENSAIKWGGIGFYGDGHKMIGNRVSWATNAGLGASGASNCLVKDNYFAYANWRIFDPNWGGGGAKLIPGNIDLHIVDNTWRFNWGAGFWFDAYNSGNMVEYNKMYDNAGHGGVFDEISWGNTFQYNLIYNNWCTRQNRSGGNGLMIAESAEDVVYRNIVFNCERGNGMLMRGYASRTAYADAEAVKHTSIKYVHHYVPVERQKKWLDKFIKYYGDGNVIYMTDVKIRENISFNNHLSQFWTMKDYRGDVKGEEWKNKYYSFTSDDNIYYGFTKDGIIRSGMGASCSLTDWRKMSGKDMNTRILNPLKEPEKLPEWARKLVDFNKLREMRTAKEIADMRVEIHDSVGSMLFKSRIVRAKKYRKLKTRDLALRVFALDVEGKPALAIWRTSGAGFLRVKTDAPHVDLEDRWLRIFKRDCPDGTTVVFAGQDPFYLFGVGPKARVDPTYKSKVFGSSKELLVKRAPNKFVPDGDLKEWKRSAARNPMVVMDNERAVIPNANRKWGGPKDVSADVRVGWKADGLYFAFDVKDDSVQPAGDKVEIFIDGREVWRHFFIEYQTPGTCHIAVTADGKVSFPKPGKKNYYQRKANPKGVVARAKKTATGYTIEVMVPYNKTNFIAAKLKKDTVIRMGFLVTDVDAKTKTPLLLRWSAFEDSSSSTSGWMPVATR